MKNFWEARHAENDIQSLSGHPGSAIINGLYIKDLVKPGIRVLEIGVGLGICTKDFAALGCRMSVLDISENALRRVADIVDYSYLDRGEIKLLPYDFFDLSVSYCVAQHMNNSDLARQLKNVVKSLKPDGTFAMQYAIPFHDVNYIETTVALEAGSVCRPLEMMYDMVARAGGVIKYHRIWGMFPQYRSGWAIAHISRK